MNRDDCYRILEISRGATEDEIRRAWRELNKVWHPDRFGNDPGLRRKAEEKLKQINRAYDILRNERGGTGASSQDAGAANARRDWAVRDDHREVTAESFQQIVRWLLAGRLEGSDELFDPRTGEWTRIHDVPELARLLRILRLQKWTRFALVAGILGFLLLIRRPAGFTAALGLALIGFAFVILWLYRRAIR